MGSPATAPTSTACGSTAASGCATAIGSGGNYALAAARALMPMQLDADEIVRRSMRIAGEICVYTNFNLIVESL